MIARDNYTASTRIPHRLGGIMRMGLEGTGVMPVSAAYPGVYADDVPSDAYSNMAVAARNITFRRQAVKGPSIRRSRRPGNAAVPRLVYARRPPDATSANEQPRRNMQAALQICAGWGAILGADPGAREADYWWRGRTRCSRWSPCTFHKRKFRSWQ
jgi:hypothetical protein